LIVLVWMAVSVPPAGATLLIPADVAELARDARAIARGRVVAVAGQWTDGRRTIETMVTLEIETYLKGQLADAIQFRVPGGVLGRFRNIVVGAPQFSVGERVIVFLGARGPTVPFVLGLNQGVFRIVERGGIPFVSPAPIAMSASTAPIVRGQVSREPRPLAEFERQVRALAGDSPQ
jgi:hypothetical protein